MMEMLPACSEENPSGRRRQVTGALLSGCMYVSSEIRLDDQGKGGKARPSFGRELSE